MKQLFAASSIAAVIGALVFTGCQKNEPPDIASVPSGSSVGSPGTTYFFSSSAADPDGDSVAIRFDWGDGDTSDWSAWKASGDSIAASHSWSDSGGYYIAAQARDRQDATSDWSAGHQIEISAGAGSEAPDVPATPSGPDAGTTGTEYTFVSSTVDPDGDSVAIRFDWGDGDTSDWSSWAACGDSISTTHSWSDSGSYSIRAQARDAGNAVSAWSSGHQIVISGGGGSGWIRTFGGSSDNIGRSVDVCSDGGYIIVGYADPGGDNDIYLVKTDSQGNSQRYTTIGGGSDDYGMSVQETNDGAYVITGTTFSWSPVGNQKIYFAKIRPDLTREWEFQLGYDDRPDAGFSVQQTQDGGYILVGYTGWVRQLFLIKRQPDGTPHWSKTRGWDNSHEIGYSVQQTSDGGYITVGTTNQFGNDYDVYLHKALPSGDTDTTLWFFPGAGQGTDVGYSVQQTSDGGYIIAGTTNSQGAGESDVYLVKRSADSLGGWQRTFGGQDADSGWSVIQTLDGGYLVVGSTESFGAGGSDVYLVKTDANGDTAWTRTFGGPGDDGAYSVCRSYDSYIVAGYTTTSAGDKDIILIKVDANGNVK